ncbi:unnamed protein product [Parnassius apollo]|uniref:(apollo) hypothetical protein n=1 Tax=Parnassius apollo TaxID=110799 RepID=A0A8S3WYK7_PARAO|nr:unnamed protein product [Parnassius apollo]
MTSHTNEDLQLEDMEKLSTAVREPTARSPAQPPAPQPRDQRSLIPTKATTAKNHIILILTINTVDSR